MRAEERRLRGSRVVPHLLHGLLVCGRVSSLRHVGAAQLRLDSTEVRSSLEGERGGEGGSCERAWRGVEARACIVPAQPTAAQLLTFFRRRRGRSQIDDQPTAEPHSLTSPHSFLHTPSIWSRRLWVRIQGHLKLQEDFPEEPWRSRS